MLWRWAHILGQPAVALDRVAAAAVAGAAALTIHMLPSVRALRRVRLPVAARLSGLGDPGQVALSFDDGPDPAATELFLAALERGGARATFFVLGESVRRMPSLAKEIVAAGHELGVHGWTHRHLTLASPTVIYAELARTTALIEDLVGERPRYFRPPYGILTVAGVVAANRLKLTPRLWSCSGREWRRGARMAPVLAALRSGLCPGATILLHDSDIAAPAGTWRRALAALPHLLDDCAELGLRVVPVREHA
jgi:peptidoglycan/xylan/chitin deacetylase (PgdA/CDA1 family)